MSPLKLSLLWILLVAGMPAMQDSPELHLGRGYDALRQNRFDEAADEFRAALQIDPALVMRARFPLAIALFDMKQTAEARKEFETVRRELGDNPNTSYYLGRLDLLDQSFESAIRNLTKAIANPPFPDTAYHLGFACLKRGDLAAAEKWLKVAEKTTPDDGAVPYQLALVYRQGGREEDSKKQMAKSVELRQRKAEQSQLENDCAQKLDHGPRDEARQVCARLYDPNDADKLTALGTLYGQHGDLEAALQPLQRAAELAPQSPQMQYNLAFTYYEMNRFEEARGPIAKAVERWPDIFQLNSLYGAVLLKLGMVRDAWPVLDRAHQLKPTDARTSELLYRTALALARSNLDAHAYADALRFFGEAAKLRPDELEPQRGKAEVEAAAGAARR